MDTECNSQFRILGWRSNLRVSAGSSRNEKSLQRSTYSERERLGMVKNGCTERLISYRATTF